MDSDWGGQGPASIPSGNSCFGLGADKCASITVVVIAHHQWVYLVWVTTFINTGGHI
jgi:hypothetical protein